MRGSAVCALTTEECAAEHLVPVCWQCQNMTAHTCLCRSCQQLLCGAEMWGWGGAEHRTKAAVLSSFVCGQPRAGLRAHSSGMAAHRRCSLNFNLLSFPLNPLSYLCCKALMESARASTELTVTQRLDAGEV